MGILDKAGIQNIEIIDCNEKLEVLNTSEFVLLPMYYRWGFSNSEVIELRSGLIERLRSAKKTLKPGWNFKIWDGYRTLHTQGLLYEDYWNRLKKENPEWTDSELKKAVEIFVSFPSKDIALPAPHNTGGAVDLTLVDEKGNDIQMGTDFDEFHVKSYTDHFSDKKGFFPRRGKLIFKNKSRSELHSVVSAGLEAIFHQNRMLLKKVLEDVGFVNYHEEWWHFSYGDQEWARQNGLNQAVYGSMEL